MTGRSIGLTGGDLARRSAPSPANLAGSGRQPGWPDPSRGAADLLHSSRTCLIKLLERDELPYERRGKHRRLKASDVLEYRRCRATARRDKLAELTRLSDEYGGYDV
jgi:excisionase family DNA binding protein